MKYRITTEAKQRSRNAKDKQKHKKTRGLKGVRKKLYKKLGGHHWKILSSTQKANKILNSEDTEEAHQVLNITLAPLWNKAHRWATRACHSPCPVLAKPQHLALRCHTDWTPQTEQVTLNFRPGWNNKPWAIPRELTLLTLLPLMTLRKKHERLMVSNPGKDITVGKSLESENH